MDIKDVEKSVFRKLISNPKTLAANLTKISPEDFSIPLARTVISAMGQNGHCVHYSPSREYFEIVLRDRIPEKDRLESASAALAELAASPQDQRDLEVLIKELKHNRMCKEMTTILQNAANNLEPGRVEEAYDNLLRSLLNLPLLGSTSHSVGRLKDVFGDLEDRLQMYFTESKRKFPTGLRAFNETIGGFAPGELIVLTAGTGQGKSALMGWWANQFLHVNANVMYATLEMSYEEMMERYHAMVTGLSMRKIRNKSMSPEELTTFNEKLIADTLDSTASAAFIRECASIVDRTDPKYALELAQKFPRRKTKFFMLDIPKNCSPARIEREISRVSLDCPIHVVFVDYLNIMEPNYHSRDWVREQGSLAKDLKEVARKTGTIVFTGAQLNTSNMEGGEKITTDSIKYARAISENSDWVIGFHRDENDIAMKQIRLQLAKHRFSASATATIEVDFETMQVRDMGRAEDLPSPEPTAKDEDDRLRANRARMFSK